MNGLNRIDTGRLFCCTWIGRRRWRKQKNSNNTNKIALGFIIFSIRGRLLLNFAHFFIFSTFITGYQPLKKTSSPFQFIHPQFVDLRFPHAESLKSDAFVGSFRGNHFPSNDLHTHTHTLCNNIIGSFCPMDYFAPKWNFFDLTICSAQSARHNLLGAGNARHNLLGAGNAWLSIQSRTKCIKV